MTVLVLMLALELLAHGALLLARREEAASRAGVRLMQARLAARRGLRLEVAPAGVSLREVPVGGLVEVERGTLGAGRWRVRLERLGPEAWLARSDGGVRGAGWWVGEAILAWLPDPLERLRAFEGVIVVGREAPVLLVGTVDTATVRRDPAGRDPGTCSAWSAALDSLYARGAPAPVTTVEPAAGGEPSLGPLGPEELLGWIGDAPAGGWARAVRGDLSLRREVGAGLLVVEGDLELVGGRYEGLVLVGGRLTLRDGAELLGFARAGGGVEVATGARVVGSGCRALEALERGLEGRVRPFTRGNRAFPVP